MMSKARTQERLGGCGLLVMGLWASAAVGLGAQTADPLHYQVTGRFASSKVTESSGVAVSRSQPGILWTHNDSGDKARLFATDREGRDLGTFEVRGAKAKDWEDVALGPCTTSVGDCLYIADTGDNEHRREHVFVYVVAEPRVDRADVRTRKTAVAHRLRVRYPDGPHDVEALAVSPKGDIYLITKGRRGGIVAYVVPAESVRQESVVATRSETLPITPQPALGRWVTGAAISPDGTLMVVRTYTEIFLFARDTGGGFTLKGGSCWLGRRQVRGEAIDFVRGDTLVLTTESARGRPGIIAIARCST